MAARTQASERARVLDAAALARLASLKLRVRAVVEGSLAGLHRSPHRGASVEFAEHKEYAPGDDLRRLDWKAYAKFDRYYIRRYEDETELDAYLALDRSGSMGYGAPMTKLAFGAVLLGSLAYLLARQRDRPGLLTFGGGEFDLLPPRGHGEHLARLLGALARLEPGGATGVGAALRRLAEQSRRRALVVVVSDLFDADPRALAPLGLLRARRHEVVVVHLLHDDELTFPFRDVTLFEDMEGPGELLVDPPGVRRAYLAEMRAFVERCRAACREAEVGYRLVRTSDALDRVIPLLAGASPSRGAAAPPARGGAAAAGT